MLKKIFYFGLGLASLFFENFDELARAGEERYNKRIKADQPTEETINITTSKTAEPVSGLSKVEASNDVSDDLTAISGIGPTFASRLSEAGITTYQELAGLSVEQVRDITQVADWQANPDDWIAQAKAVS
ncbi:MAG: hypothetical protein GWP61_02315 [Chloroflexi bacterium]|nr:hypothetical protein [Chloroflexota bacterium]